MTFDQIWQAIVDFFAEFDFFSAIETVLLFLLGRNVSKIKKSEKVTGPEQAAKSLAKEQKAKKKALKKEMLAALDVLYSDKPDADLTEEEKAACDKVLAYINQSSEPGGA